MADGRRAAATASTVCSAIRRVFYVSNAQSIHLSPYPNLRCVQIGSIWAPDGWHLLSIRWCCGISLNDCTETKIENEKK